MSPLRIATFITVLTLLSALLHRYLWARLVRDPGLPPTLHTGLTALFVALWLLIPATMIASRLLPRAQATTFAYIGYGWMGLVFYLFVLTGLADLVRLGFWGAGVVAGGPVLTDDRRAAFDRMAALATTGFAAALAGWGFYSAGRPLDVVKVKVPVKGLDPRLVGFRIVQISDIHVGPTIGKGFVEAIVAKVNGLDADLVALTGDLVDGSVDELGPLVAPLAGLKSRHGHFFTTGNHEYYSGALNWERFLPTLGFKVLRNEHVRISHGGALLQLAGTDDWSAFRFGHGHGEDIAKAVAGRDPQAPLVLMAHQPKSVLEAMKHSIDVQLSGHTHGGQIMPFNWLVRFDQPHVAGLQAFGDTQLYVSRGTGYWGPPMRVGAPAEVTLIELVAA